MNINIKLDISSAMFLLLVLPVYLASIVLVFFDGRKRGKSGLLTAIFVALAFWPISLVAWLLFRPDLLKQDVLEENHERTARIPCTCGRQILVKEGMAGTKIACPICEAEVLVPELSRLRVILAGKG